MTLIWWASRLISETVFSRLPGERAPTLETHKGNEPSGISPDTPTTCAKRLDRRVLDTLGIPKICAPNDLGRLSRFWREPFPLPCQGEAPNFSFFNPVGSLPSVDI